MAEMVASRRRQSGPGKMVRMAAAQPRGDEEEEAATAECEDRAERKSGEVITQTA